jgi:hypothetical protein
MPISTFPRHDYYEDEYLLKPAGLRDTHSEGKVKQLLKSRFVSRSFRTSVAILVSPLPWGK